MGDCHPLGRLIKPLLVGGFAMRAGRSDAPCTLVSNGIRLAPMPGGRGHVTQGRMEPFFIIVVHQCGNDRLGLQIVILLALKTFDHLKPVMLA